MPDSCEVCGGTGRIQYGVGHDGRMLYGEVPCGRCQGPCETCGGTRLVTLTNVVVSGVAGGDADDQPCPDCT